MCGYVDPMHGKLESLNAAVAASILMYEVCRQRREKIKNLIKPSCKGGFFELFFYCFENG